VPLWEGFKAGPGRRYRLGLPGSGNRGSNRERDIRKAFGEHALIETVILLPENLFYNTPAPGVILLVNASRPFAKGRPKNYLTEEHIERIVGIYHEWMAEEDLSAIITAEEAARNDYNLSPSRYVAVDESEEVLPLEEAEEERKETDRELQEVLRALGLLEKMHAEGSGG